MPDFCLENNLNSPVCGIDEVGRGPLAGPVVAGCVYIPDNVRALPFIAEIKDSKKLSKSKLIALHEQIQNHCRWAVAGVSPQTIDEINILQASLKAMKDAFECLKGHNFSHALIDGNKSPELPCPVTTVIKGDNISTSIAAASIMAKVTRDNIMSELAAEHPEYGWERNAGYPTPAHLAAIDAHGITPHHRKSFAPVQNFIEFGCVKAPLRKIP